MSQDTRKDKRAKVVSLNVRYKSATVDEFIENHSHDVSKGGLFVKTPTPFPPGTLLKFEIRLAGDKSVISGVGRVVWKREPMIRMRNWLTAQGWWSEAEETAWLAYAKKHGLANLCRVLFNSSEFLFSD